MKQTFEVLNGAHYDVCFLLAGITDIKYCEQFPREAERINVSNTVTLIKFLFAEKIISKLVFMSTNQVFDGSEAYPLVSQKTQPYNMYGRFKKQVEDYILKSIPNGVIVRLTKVIGSNFPLFEDKLKLIEKKQTVSVFNDMVISPIPLALVLECLMAIIHSDEDASMVIHLSGKQNHSYFDILCFLASKLKLESGLVRAQSKVDCGVDSPEFGSLYFNAENLLADISAPLLEDAVGMLLVTLEKQYV